MGIDVRLVTVGEMAGMRERYRRGMHCQIVHDSWCIRFKTDVWVAEVEGKVAGYCLVDREHHAGVMYEFFCLPEFWGRSRGIFFGFLRASGATGIRAQTNDRWMMLMLQEFGEGIGGKTILFADARTSALTCAGAVFRKRGERENVFAHEVEPVGEWVVEVAGRVVATGGVFLHYNPPFGDVYMEVEKEERRKGYGSFLVQEAKRVCYAMGKVPAARCYEENVGSRGALERAGFVVCGRVLEGRVRTVVGQNK